MDPYIGEVRLFAGNFAPADWAFCDGTKLAIAQYDTLYQLIGTTYGGDGQTNFALPDLRSRVPLHVGPGVTQGQAGGVETVTLNTGQIAAHTHPLRGISSSNARSPAGAYPAAVTKTTGGLVPTLYGTGGGKPTTLSPQSIGLSAGGNQPHGNVQPYLALNFIISLFGIFPPRS